MAATTDISKLMARFLKSRGPTSPIVSGRNIPTRGPTSPAYKGLPKPEGRAVQPFANPRALGTTSRRGNALAERPSYNVTPSGAKPTMRNMGYVQEVPPTPPRRLTGPTAAAPTRPASPRSSRGSGKTLAAAGAALTAGVAAGAAVYGGGTGSKAPDTRPNPATVWTGPSAPVRGKPSTGGPTTRPKIGPKPAATRPAPAPQPAPKTPPRTIKTWEQRTAPTANVPMSPKASSPNTGGRQMDDEYGSYYTGQAQRNKKFGRIDR